jgi:uncharacterized protein YsxB (DUF464 family)
LKKERVKMLKIDAHKQDNSFTLLMDGHCGFDDEGKDILCAAASILCLALERVIRENEDKLISPPIIEIEKGRCRIEFEAKNEYSAALNNVFYTVNSGFRILAAQYPDNITYDVV